MNFIPVNVPEITLEEKRYLQEAIDSNWVSSSGKYISLFEEAFSSYIGKDFGVAVSNGSAALDIAISALALPKGSVIAVPNFTIISPVLSVLRAGYIPKLLDVDFNTCNVSIETLDKGLTSDVKAFVAVHIYGLCMDMDKAEKLCAERDVILIEDAAEAHGLEVRGRMIGSYGVISTYSFFANKLITSGEGGMAITNNKEIYAKMQELRNIGFSNNGPRYIHSINGWNYRMTNMQAALGLGQFENIAKKLEKKRHIGQYYDEHIVNERLQKPPLSLSYCENTFWVYGITTKSKYLTDKLKDYLKLNKIDFRNYFYPMHLQPLFQNEDWSNIDAPVSEELHNRGIYVPCGIGITQEEQDRVIEVLNRFD